MNDGGTMKEEKRRPGNSFGAAMGMLRRMDPDKAPGVVRRFNAAVTSEDMTEFSRHALGAVQLLRASELATKIDYPGFAADLFEYQIPARRDGVVLKWGRDFWREHADNNSAEGAE